MTVKISFFSQYEKSCYFCSVKDPKTYNNSTTMFGQGIFLNTFFQKKHLYKFPKVQTESNDSACLYCCSFTGKEKDSETGFYYFGARYYDPALSGLFISIDPMSDKYPSISPYAYCVWNPVKLVDPDGMDALENVDWYKSRYGDKYIWREGHATSINVNDKVYDNVGESHSISLGDGNYLNCFQNCIVSRGEKKDVTWDAYNNDDVRADLICTESPLPLSHKKELFSHNIRTRGINMPDMIGVQVGGNVILGGGFTMEANFGYVRGSSSFLNVSIGAGIGFDISGNVGFSVGSYLGGGAPKAETLKGLDFSCSIGMGRIFLKNNTSRSDTNRWNVTTFGVSKGLPKIRLGGGAGVSYGFQLN